ncbi:MAG: glycosyltransferase family 2 protein, partial [Acidobacteriota bacterium]|nr:glycosyltransferase family 2 protein [Acidobacteriota bacterium]
GYVSFCGGDALARVDVLREVNAYREDLVAGEEPEMCHRIRALGYRIHHLDIPMTGHDLAVKTFKAYWLRCYRAGHAYAEVSRVTKGETFGRESKRNLIQGAAYMIMPPLLVLAFGWWGLAVVSGGAGLVLVRTFRRSLWRKASLMTTIAYAIHSHVCQIPIWFGQIFYYRRRPSRAGRIIEYK